MSRARAQRGPIAGELAATALASEADLSGATGAVGRSAGLSSGAVTLHFASGSS